METRIPTFLPSCRAFTDSRTRFTPSRMTKHGLYHSDRIAGLVELDLLQHLLSHLEHRGPRLAVHLHLQGHVRDRHAQEQEAFGLRGVRHLVHHPRVHHQLRHRLLLSCPAVLVRRDRADRGVRTEISRKRVPLVQSQCRKRSDSLFVLHGVLRQDQLSTDS